MKHIPTMVTYTRTLVLFLLTLAAAAPAAAQDFHMSQFDMVPLYYNPAQTGMFFGEGKTDYRFTGNFRSQWQKLQGKPYSSVDVAFDMSHKRFGFGFLLYDHIAGTSNFATIQGLLSGAYRVTSLSSHNHFLSAGFQVGFFQKRFSYRDLLFENQYTPTDGLDPNEPNGEYLPDLTIFRFDANIGIFYKYIDKEKQFAPSAGFSIYHINTPNESFTGQSNDLPMRFNAIVNCDIRINDQVVVTPNVLMMLQRKAHELNMGVMTATRISNTPYSVLAGGSYRHKDAVVFHLGMKQGNNSFRVSYDIVTSKLKNEGGGRGGFEMGVIYSGWLKSRRGVNG